MGRDPWPKAITSTVGHLSLFVAKQKRPPNPDGLSIGATRSDQAGDRRAQRGLRYSPLASAMLPSSNSTSHAMTARAPASVVGGGSRSSARSSSADRSI